ncbi:MAG: octaprenyl diphosphate synthase [Gammaproteobacteria bacterium]|nr:octaprenyl diphosphate synthase [Pseudomonadales bacterium]MCP5346487.1 octaprenyl diphosphate synthase [Pseudomonadales bacterium]
MYESIRAPVATDFEAVNRYVVDQLYSNVSLVESIGHYIVEAGGKRMRPVLVLLSARACGIEKDHHISLAAVIEFIHTATLLHDDVVDMSTMRRGRPTANSQWNNPSSVLVGDFIYSRAFQVLVSLNNMRIMQIMADTTNRIAEGEVLQLINKHNIAVTETDYLRVIHNKTAILFEAAAQCGAILAQADAAVEHSLRDFGLHVGTAFQLIDDILDYEGDAEKLGKNVGDDLAEGKPTLPLIYAMQHGSESDAQLIRDALRHGGLESLERIIQVVRDSGGLAYTRQLAEEQAQKASACLQALPESSYRAALDSMARFSVERVS